MINNILNKRDSVHIIEDTFLDVAVLLDDCTPVLKARQCYDCLVNGRCDDENHVWFDQEVE